MDVENGAGDIEDPHDPNYDSDSQVNVITVCFSIQSFVSMNCKLNILN